MADAKRYAQWIVNNSDKKGTPEFDIVAQAYKKARASENIPTPTSEDIQQRIAALKPEYGFGETISRGTSRGFTRLGSTFGDVIPAMVASGLGFDDYAKAQLGEAAQTEQELARTNAPEFQSYKDVEGVGDALKFASQVGSEQLANLATAIVPGVGLGGLAARGAVGTAAQIAAKKAAGQMAGTYLGSYALNAPEVFQNVYEETGTMAPGASALFSIASAALDSFLPASLMRTMPASLKAGIVERLLARSGMNKGLLRSVTSNVIKDTTGEAVTEAAQEGISIAAERFINEHPEAFGEEEWDRIMESAVQGGVGGGVFGIAGGAAERASERQQTAARAQNIQQIRESRVAKEQREADLGGQMELGGVPPPPPGTPATQPAATLPDVVNRNYVFQRGRQLGVIQSGKLENLTQTEQKEFDTLYKAENERVLFARAAAEAEVQGVPFDTNKTLEELNPEERAILNTVAKQKPEDQEAMFTASGAPTKPFIAKEKAAATAQNEADKLAAAETKAATIRARQEAQRQVAAQKEAATAQKAEEQAAAIRARQEAQRQKEADRLAKEQERKTAEARAAGIADVAPKSIDLLANARPPLERVLGADFIAKAQKDLDAAAAKQGKLQAGRPAPAPTPTSTTPTAPTKLSVLPTDRASLRALFPGANAGLGIFAENGPLAGRDISDPAVAAQVKTDLETAAQKYSGKNATAVETFLKKPEFQPAPTTEEPSGQAETVKTKTKKRGMGQKTSEAPATGESDTDTDTDTDTGPVDEEAPKPKGRRKAKDKPADAADTTTGTADTDTGTVDEEATASGEIPRQKKAREKAETNRRKASEAEQARKADIRNMWRPTTTANLDRNQELSDLAEKIHSGTPQEQKAARAEYATLSEEEQGIVNLYVNAYLMRDIPTQNLPASALARTAGAVDQEVLELLKNNKLADALTQMAKMRNKSISRVATALARVAGNTKVRFEAGLKNDRGEIIAGKFEPKTNTVVLNSDFAPTNHVVLHEVMHAATAAELANLSSPYTKQLKNLFNTVKDRLDTAYGAESLDEFVAEAFSNPEFQAKLAQMDTKGDRISVWSRFKNIINNIVRKFRGLPSKEVNSVRDEMDKLVMEMLAPAPEFRGAADLHSATMSNIGEDMLNVIGKTAKGTVTKEDIARFNDYMPGLRSETRKSILSVLPLNSIADYIAPQFPELSKEIKALFSLIQQKNGTRQNYLTKVRDTAKQLEKVFGKLPKEQRKLFNDVVMDSTMARVDPSKLRSYYAGYRFSYVKADGTDFRSQEYNTADERNKAMKEAMDANNLEKKNMHVSNPSKGVLEAYDELQTKWQDMDESARDAYEALRDAYSEAFTTLRKTLIARIDSIEADKDLKQTYKDRILLELLDKESIEPYFPLYRKGDYWLTYEAKDPRTGELKPYKEAFPTSEERIRRRRELEDMGVRKSSIAEAMRPASDKRQRTGTVDPQFSYNLLGNVRDNAGKYAEAAEKKVKDAGGDADAVAKAGKAARDGAAELENVVMDSLLSAMPERSLFRAFKTRANVLGAEHDALLVFRERMPAFMGQVSNLEFDAPFNKIKNNLTELANLKVNTPDGAYAREIADHAKDYADFARSPSLAPWARTVKSLGFAMTLGLNLSSALVNLFTLPMAVYPYLSGKYGYGDTFKAMNRARKLYMSTGMRRKLNTFTGVEGGLEIDGPSFTNIDFSDPASVPESFKKLGDEELRRNKVLVDVMNQQGAANASTIADLLELNTATSSTTDKVNSVMGYAFHQGERLTRQITMKATYDLILNAKSKGGKKLTDEDYMAAAQEAILETEHTNSGSMLETAPKIAQNSLGSVLLMYKRFGVSMMYMQSQMANQALKGANSTVREQAVKQLIGLFGMSGIFAGVQGLPLYGVITTLANLFLLDDEDEDADSIAASFFGEGLYSGLLNEATGWDIAPRIGMSNLIFRSLPNAEEESLTMQAIELAGGPIVGIAQRMLDSGLPLLMEGEIYRGMEKMMPSSVANVMKATRYGTEGATTLRGDPITEDLGFGTLLGQTLGFAPAGYTKQLEINARDKRVDRVINENRTKLLRQRYMAIRENDFDELIEVEEAIAEFSQRHPEVRITEDTKKKSLRQHKVTDEVTRMFNGVTISPQRRAVVMRRQLEDLDESEFFE